MHQFLFGNNFLRVGSIKSVGISDGQLSMTVLKNQPHTTVSMQTGKTGFSALAKRMLQHRTSHAATSDLPHCTVNVVHN